MKMLDYFIMCLGVFGGISLFVWLLGGDDNALSISFVIGFVSNLIIKELITIRMILTKENK